MHPVEFEGHNAVLAKAQSEYRPLPVHMAAGPEHVVTSCWALSDEDLETLRRTRCLWLSVYTFNQLLQPQLPAVTKPEHIQGEAHVADQAPDPGIIMDGPIGTEPEYNQPDQAGGRGA